MVTGLHLSEMAQMGIGSKPCVDLKPSKDNISDRYIDISKSTYPLYFQSEA